MNGKPHTRIRACLNAMASGDLATRATDMLGELGYPSTRPLLGQTGQPSDFVRTWPATICGTQSERDLLEAANSIRILFQITDTEIASKNEATELFGARGDFLDGETRSFLFAAVDLNGETYSRHHYTGFTRELNKRIQVPIVVLYRTATSRTTLAFVYRRKVNIHEGRPREGVPSDVERRRLGERGRSSSGQAGRALARLG